MMRTSNPRQKKSLGEGNFFLAMRVSCAYDTHMPVKSSSKNSGAEVTNLYLPVRIKKLGRELAEKKNLSLSQLVAQLIQEANDAP
jgi:hypothetical protein